MIVYYLRVSTEKQKTLAQRHAILEWIKKQGYENAVEYSDEGVSGKTTDRPAFNRLMADAKAGKITKIITFELSRFSRILLDSMDIMRAFTQYNIDVEIPGEGTQPFKTAIDQFVVLAKSLASAMERERIIERTKAGIKAARDRKLTKEGKPLLHWGIPKGEKKRLGKFKDYRAEDPEIVDKIVMLQKTGLSNAMIARALTTNSKVINAKKVGRIIKWLTFRVSESA